MVAGMSEGWGNWDGHQVSAMGQGSQRECFNCDGKGHIVICSHPYTKYKGNEAGIVGTITTRASENMR